jgi:hypothetical protein
MSINKWLVLLVSFIFFTGFARSETLVTTVFNVIESKKSEALLVLSGADGRVYRMAKSEANLKYLNSLRGKIVEINYLTTGHNANITKILPLDPSKVRTDELDLNHFQYHQLRKFAPTDLQNFEQSSILFNTMINDGDRRRTQCFKRAHIWSYDMWSNLGIYTQKIFIFYTQRYIQLEEFEWWFHVAPLVVANGEELVLDGTFMTKPVTLKEWKDYFIKTDKINCPLISHYSQYKDNQWSKLCYLMKTPMYIFSPLDIENRDYRNEKKNFWILEELQDARRAFRNWEAMYEGLDTGKPTRTY